VNLEKSRGGAVRRVMDRRTDAIGARARFGQALRCADGWPHHDWFRCRLAGAAQRPLRRLMPGRGERPSFTPAQQYTFLRASRVGHGTGELNATGLVREYTDRPTLLSREYLLRIEYRRGDIPQVFVKEPDIRALAGGRELPHVYKDPLALCLYLPRSGEWNGTMRIDLTFVQWAAVWLYYFEEWLASDNWKGGGIHPGERPWSPQNRRERRARRNT
jgi:hypothetical protein